MSSTYRWLLTPSGLAKRARAEVSGAISAWLTGATFLVGDGGGVDQEPENLVAGLVRQVWSGPVTNFYLSPSNPFLVIIETVIPPNVGPFDIREAGILDADNALILVGNYPLTQKPDPASGGQKEILLRGGLIVSNGGDLVLQMDTSLVMATQAFVEAYAAPINHTHQNNASIGGPYDLAGSDNTPVGTMIYMPRLTPPARYRKVNGELLVRTEWPLLWAEAQASGNLVSEVQWQAGQYGAYSTGDGNVSFRIPDYRGVGVRGADDGRGLAADCQLGLYTPDAIKPHAHNVGIWTVGVGGAGVGSFVDSNAGSGYKRTAQSGDYGNAAETRVKANIGSWFIKYM